MDWVPLCWPEFQNWAISDRVTFNCKVQQLPLSVCTEIAIVYSQRQRRQCDQATPKHTFCLDPHYSMIRRLFPTMYEMLRSQTTKPQQNYFQILMDTHPVPASPLLLSRVDKDKRARIIWGELISPLIITKSLQLLAITSSLLITASIKFSILEQVKMVRIKFTYVISHMHSVLMY